MTAITIRRDDTMWEIARHNNIQLTSLRQANPGVNPRKLQIGQRLQLPGARDSFQGTAAHHHHAAQPSPTRTNTTRTSPQEGVRANQRVPYRNGRIPSNPLTDVGGGHRMFGTAARSYTQMRDAARRDGINIRLTDSYRSYPAQVDVARRKGIYGVRQPNGRLGLAARPGTSNHGLGRAVDVNLGASPGASEWLRRNGARHGFHTIPREPWHWEYRG